MTSSDQRASILAVIAQEKKTVAHYATLIAAEPQNVRWPALRRYHQAQIKKWRKELRDER